MTLVFERSTYRLCSNEYSVPISSWPVVVVVALVVVVSVLDRNDDGDEDGDDDNANAVLACWYCSLAI